MTRQDYLRLAHDHLLARLYAFPDIQSVFTKVDSDGLHLLAFVSATGTERLNAMAVAATMFEFIDWLSQGLAAIEASAEPLPPIKSRDIFSAGEMHTGPMSALVWNGWKPVPRPH